MNRQVQTTRYHRRTPIELLIASPDLHASCRQSSYAHHTFRPPPTQPHSQRCPALKITLGAFRWRMSRSVALRPLNTDSTSTPSGVHHTASWSLEYDKRLTLGVSISLLIQLLYLRMHTRVIKYCHFQCVLSIVVRDGTFSIVDVMQRSICR